MTANVLLLNSDKSEVQIFGPKKYRNNLSNLTLDLNGIKVYQSQESQWTQTFRLSNILSNIQNFLSKDDAEKLIHVFVTSRLDYCNVLFSGLTSTYLKNV